MNPGPIVIEPCTPRDASWLRALAIACYAPFYTGLWEPGAMAAYLDSTYAPERLAEELADPNVRFEIAWAGNAPVGFMKTLARCDRADTPNAAYLERVYVLPAVAGHRVGTCLIEHALARARAQRRTWIWLQAMADAREALARYHALGFVTFANSELAMPGVRRDRAPMRVLRRAP